MSGIWRQAKGWPRGQVADFRRRLPDGRCEHVRLFSDGTTSAHVDLVDPGEAPFWHLVLDVLPWIARGAPRGSRSVQPELLGELAAAIPRARAAALPPGPDAGDDASTGSWAAG